MDDKELEEIRLHIAGATVRHKTPFDDLVSHKNGFELTQDFINKWAVPYCMSVGIDSDDNWIKDLCLIKKEITDEVISKLLGDFDWRTRQTGAFFAAITNKPKFVDIIGTHLVKSEVCYAGGIYCYALASFNTKKCVDYITLYLDHYLKQIDLWFDQGEAMQAICYLDKINKTNYFTNYKDKWLNFIENKSHWKKEITTDRIEKQIHVIEAVKKYADT